ncbi:MAG: N-formylglutamate amidohydrolase [Rhodospirillaceae bacterium]
MDPVELINPHGLSDLIITGDHAGNAVPPELKDLGLPAAELARHIGWDIGAADVARKLAKRLGATAVLARVSRLVIDPNRALGEPESIPSVSDGSPIPGNQNLSAAERAARAANYFQPYHAAIDSQIERLRRAGRRPAVLCMHSFTPQLTHKGRPRPWHIGVMSSFDRELADYLIAAFSAKEGLVVGDNEPYSGITHGYAQKRHGLAQMLPHAQLEIRQDLISDEAGQERWADLLADVMTSWMERGLSEVANG